MTNDLKFAFRRDENHREIEARLKEYGYIVADMSALGRGFPDIIISTPHFDGEMWLAEIKDGKHKDFTELQYDFQAKWRGKAIVFFRTVKDVDFFHVTVGMGK